MSTEPINQTKNERAEQSRINGSQSHGPSSPEGKAKSSKNALKHGFAATVNNVLRIEDPEEFKAHVEGIHAAWSPKDYYEKVIVDQIASITWRHARLVTMETFLIGGQISLQNARLESTYSVATIRCSTVNTAPPSPTSANIARKSRPNNSGRKTNPGNQPKFTS